MKRIFDNYWVKSGLFTLSQRLSVRLIGVVSFVVLVRLIDENQMGTWALFLGISTMFEMLRNGLLKSAFVKFYSEAKREEKSVILTSSLVINTLFSFLLALLLFFGASIISGWLNAPDLAPMLQIVSVTTILTIPFSHFEYLQQGEMNFKGIMWSYLARQGLLFVLIIGATFSWFGAITTTHLAWFHLAGVILGGIVSFLYAKKYLLYQYNHRWPWSQKLWRFGRFGLFSNLGTSMLNSADQYLIGGLMNTRAVAVYSVASRTTNIFTMPSVAIADILYPKTVKALSSEGVTEVKKLYENAVGAILAAMLPAMVIVLIVPELIILIVAGDTYLEAKNILQIAILSIIVRPFIAQFGTVVNTLGKPNYNFVFVCSLSIIGIILNYVFIKSFGLIGAAFANLLTMIFGLVVSQLILRREAGITIQGVLACTKKFLLLMPNKIGEKLKNR